MVTISNKETALLMLLSEEPMHAYMINREITNRSMREWTEISMSSVYKLLRKLEKERMIRGDASISKTNNVSQRTYSLTEKGRSALKTKIKELISEPEHMICRVDLATSHLCLLTKKEALDCLNKYGDKLKADVKCYKELEAYLRGCNCSKHALALARRPQHLLRGELEWLAEYRRDVLRDRTFR